MSKTSKGLESEWKQVETSIQKRKLLVFPNMVHFDETYAAWPEEQGVESFLDLAQSLNIRLVYSGKTEFSSGEMEELVAELRSDESEDEEAISSATQHIYAIAKPFLGRTMMFWVQWVYEGIIHIFRKTADWYEDLENSLADDQATIEAQREKQVEQRKAKLQETTQALASNSGFQKTRNWSARYDVAKRLYPNLAEDEIAELVDSAWQIYESEILPVQENALVKKARGLLESGQSLTRVANNLGMTSGRLERLLARYASD